MTADCEDSHESEAVEIYVDSNTKKFSKKNITNFRAQTELSDFTVVQDHHQQWRETLSKKMMLKSKKATVKNFVGGFTT